MVDGCFGVFFLLCFGCWGIRKLLSNNPKVGKAASDGAASLVTRLFSRLF